MSEGVQRRTVAGAELGEGGTVLPRKDEFFLGDVRGLKVEDWVEWPGSEGFIHILSVQLLPGLLGVLDCSVAEETLNVRTKPELERFLLIPGAGVRSDCRIGRVAGLKGCDQELAAE